MIKVFKKGRSTGLSVKEDLQGAEIGRVCAGTVEVFFRERVGKKVIDDAKQGTVFLPDSFTPV